MESRRGEKRGKGRPPLKEENIGISPCRVPARNIGLRGFYRSVNFKWICRAVRIL